MIDIPLEIAEQTPVAEEALTTEQQRERVRTAIAEAHRQWHADRNDPGHHAPLDAYIENHVVALIASAQGKDRGFAAKFLACRLPGRDGGHGGWRISGTNSINELARALDPKHMPPLQEHHFVDPRVTLTPEELAAETQRFDEAALHSKPMDVAALDAQLRHSPAAAPAATMDREAVIKDAKLILGPHSFYNTHAAQRVITKLLFLLQQTTRELNCDDGGLPWRCFHCGEVFTNCADANDHFGYMEDGAYEAPACKLTKDEKGLVGLLREAWAELRGYHQEDSAMARVFHRLGGEHAAAVRQAEELGYAKGLADGRALGRESAA